MRVLLVEDDELIAQGIVAGLRAHGITVRHAGSAAQAQAAQHEDSYQAMVLDLGLPDCDGLTLLQRVRAFEPCLPIIILSARDAVEHRLAGLHAGADDYLVKPFDLRELAARLHALQRRTQGRAAQLISAGPLRLEPDSGQAWLNEQPVPLSRREVDLLTQLAEAGGRWLSPETLNERLYGLGEEVSRNALTVHIHNIRRKLGHEAIETTRGLGYRLGWRVEP
ncbi:response regulator [Bordetella trematum]|uniref:response regulator n=1 Tax=Bordetella trematum TaxID=123899 RepID=UPI000D9385D3|nr:response regulator [Bordetella trematum]SPU51019.1 two component response regulator [Bordetella trematum]VDH07273.1 Transcriptional regulatory protein BasR [Bordetella trematum]